MIIPGRTPGTLWGAEDGTLGVYKASPLTTVLILQSCTGFSYWSVGPTCECQAILGFLFSFLFLELDIK